MYYEWSLGLVAMAFIPFILVSFYMQRIVMAQENMGNAKIMENTTKLAVEVVSNIRTVVSLAREDMFHRTYIEILTPAVVVSNLISPYIPSRFTLFRFRFIEIEEEHALSRPSLWPGQINDVLRICRMHVLWRLVRGQSEPTDGQCIQVSTAKC